MSSDIIFDHSFTGNDLSACTKCKAPAGAHQYIGDVAWDAVTPLGRWEAFISADSSSDRWTTLLALRLDDVGVRIGWWENGWVITWTDYVANDWAEYYGELSTVFARLSVLMYARETDWAACFDLGAGDFVHAAEVWFREMAK
jgi:hypothetical protein